MKKILLVAADPVGASLRLVLTTMVSAEFVTDPAQADVVLAHRREEVLKALEDTTLPVWQLTLGEGVNNKRVKQFYFVDAIAKMVAELTADQPAQAG